MMADYILRGIDPETWRKLKAALARDGRTVKDFLSQCIEKKAKEAK